LSCFVYRPTTRRGNVHSLHTVWGHPSCSASDATPWHLKSLLARFILYIGKRLLNHRQLHPLARPPSGREAVNISRAVHVGKCIICIFTTSVLMSQHSQGDGLGDICAAVTTSTETHAEEHLSGKCEDAIGLLQRARQAAVSRRRGHCEGFDRTLALLRRPRSLARASTAARDCQDMAVAPPCYQDPTPPR